MNNIKSNDTSLYNVIEDVINSSLSKNKLVVSKEFFSHNTLYKNGITIIKHGILSANEKEKRNVFKNVYQYVDNVNGRDFISVSKDENIRETGFKITYTVDYPLYLNFLIDEKKIKKITRVMRNCQNFTNEYIIENCIPKETFLCIETRLLKFIELLRKQARNVSREQLIESYNELINIIKFLNDKNIILPITESSDNSDNRILINKKEFLNIAPRII